MAAIATKGATNDAIERQGRTEKTAAETEPEAWPNGPSPWGTPAEVARYMRTSETTLCRLRERGDGPRWSSPTDHRPVYHIDDVKTYMEGRRSA